MTTDLYLGETITIDDVVLDANFFRHHQFFFREKTRLREEIRRLEYGTYLARVEIFRLRARLVGLTEDFVEERLPAFVRTENTCSLIQHGRLRQNLEFLRADLILHAARLKQGQS